ncbi:MAG: PhoH family protein [Rhizobiales bacterium]|nr:PhoH family protein [Hyphomicrobiales bacterium]MBI3673258.1 PhoH family protein [Hyphomicrobiales bacterium]
MNPPVTAATLAGAKPGSPSHDTDTLTLAFDDNRLLSVVCGGHDENLALIEHRLGLDITPRGNRLALRGPNHSREQARDVLAALYARARRGLEIARGDVEGAIRMREAADAREAGSNAIRTRRKVVTPRTPNQGKYVEAIRANELVFGTGPAGTGKTYLAVACAAEALMNGDIDRIVLSRPAVEAGERLGFLPGDMKEKVDPYLRPLYDALFDMMPAALVTKGIAENQIEIAPLAFMRGRTLSSAFIILDEAQNTTPLQMKMFLTRLGEGSRMVVTGDPSQVDLPTGVTSGLADAVATLKGVDGVAVVPFGNADIVRHPLVGRIVAAYDRKAAKPKK